MGFILMINKEYLFIKKDFITKHRKLTAFRYAAAPKSSSWVSRIRKIKKDLLTELENLAICRQNFCPGGVTPRTPKVVHLHMDNRFTLEVYIANFMLKICHK